jgi:outer membrane protein W
MDLANKNCFIFLASKNILNQTISIMRKVALIFFVISSHVGFTQVQKGDSNIGVNTLISSLVGTESPNVNGLVNLSYQYYVSNNISLGVGPFYSFSSNKTEGPGFSSEDWSDTFGLNVFANYSFLTASAKVMPYLGAQFTYQGTFSGSDMYIGTTYEGSWQDIYNSSVGGNAGIKFFVTERVNFDANLSYTTILSTTIETESTTFEPDPEGGLLQFTIGLGIILGKRE